MVLSKIKKWQYPVIAKSSGDSKDKKDITAKLYYKALLSAKNGFHPVSINNLVHTGVHFDKDALVELGITKPIKTKVNCIADGEVIAYRVNGHYQKIDYDEKVAFFSTGFVLVRHLLEMERVPEKKAETTESTPPADNNSTPSQAPNADTNSASNPSPAIAEVTPNQSPATNAETSPATTPAPTPSETTENEKKEPGHQLYFYSLYMHLADSAYYDKYPDEPAPAFWEQDIYRVIDKQLQNIVGLRIREKAKSSSSSSIKAVLQKGTKINLNLNLHDNNNKWYAVTSLVDGYTSIPTLTPFEYKNGNNIEKILGWVYTGKAVEQSEFEIQGEDSNLAKSKGLAVNDENGKNVISTLPIGTQIKITGTKNENGLVELTEIIRDGKPTIPLPEAKKMVNLACLKKISRGKKYDEVVVLDTPFPIKAGDLVGHIGNYHDDENAAKKGKDKEGKPQDIEILPDDTFKDTYFNPLLHVECFTCEDLTNYITQTQTEAGKLNDADKTFLAISKGAKLLATPNKGDTTVGKSLVEDESIRVSSKNVNVNWLQIQVPISKTISKVKEKNVPTIQTKTLWIANNKNIIKKAVLGGKISLNAKTEAWTQHPLQIANLPESPQIIDTPLLLNIYDKQYLAEDKFAQDEHGNLWWKVEALDSRNRPIVGWVSSKDVGVKKVSVWDWFDFSRLTENASLVEFYKDVELSEKRNKDNPSLDKYQLTLKTTLSILDRQYPTDSPENKKYAYIKDKCFEGIKEKPILFEALGRLLVNYKSEWYSEINTEGKMPDREALNSVMTEDAENVLGYLRDGDEAKRDAHLKNIGKTADSEEAAGLQERRDKISQFPADYKQNPKEKLNPAQLEQYYYMQKLETDVANWEKEKEKIKQCLWWDDVVKGLANQNQSTTDSGAISENESTPSTPTEQTEPEAPPPATLNPNGKAWFIHPISIINYFSVKTYLFEKGDKHEIIREINIRLAGFGGNVPTDEFTDRTEKMIKQFQRDYMKVEETGIVDMKVIEAIDKFQKEHPIETYFEQAKCQCSTLKLVKGDKACGGFGLERHSEEKQKKDPIEMYRKYEYPGLHRTLFWVLRAWKFYLKHFDQRNMEIELVESGYRCWSNNRARNRSTTNHMGKALDIHMVYNNPKITVANLCDDAREVMIKYCNAYYRWYVKNVISLEAGNRVKISTDKAIASTWVHFDVRSFELDYLKDEYFAKSVEQVNGLSMRSLIANKD